MIRVLVYHVEKHGNEELIGEMRIKRRIAGYYESTDKTGDYSVEMGIERSGGTVGIHRRALLGFQRTKFNAFALIKAVLDEYSEEDLVLEGPILEKQFRDWPRDKPQGDEPQKTLLRRLLGG